MDLNDLRVEYSNLGLTEADLHGDPIVQLEQWLAQAIDAGVTEPNAMVLATVDDKGQPSTRNVLLKQIDDSKLVYFSHAGSNKSEQIVQNPKVSITFSWLALERQAHVRGVVSSAPTAVADAYWAKRSRSSQLGSAISIQSQPVASREAMEEAFEELDGASSGSVQRPDTWLGWQVEPTTIEFWQGRPNRLHDRFLYQRQADESWELKRLWP